MRGEEVERTLTPPVLPLLTAEVISTFPLTRRGPNGPDVFTPNRNRAAVRVERFVSQHGSERWASLCSFTCFMAHSLQPRLAQIGEVPLEFCGIFNKLC